MIEGMNTNNPAQTSSNLFVVKVADRSTTPMEVRVYHNRHVNMVFQNKYEDLFKIVPPSPGCMLHIERPFIIDLIEYVDGKIVLWLSPSQPPKSD